MFFKKKSKKVGVDCISCGSNIDKKFSFCPYCGSGMLDQEREMKEFGMLGKNDIATNIGNPLSGQGFGLTDKIIGSLVNNLMKNLDKQFRQMEKAEVKSLPNGIRIKIGALPMGMPQNKKQSHKSTHKKSVSDAQIERMSLLPRAIAKSSVKRLSDKVIYELTAPGIESTDDVFISKLEEGYEIKAIGGKKVYVNSIPIDLPLKGFSVTDNKLLVEFHPE